MYRTNIYKNDNIVVTNQKGPFSILTYVKDLSVTKESAIHEYFAQEMNVHRRQLVCELSEGDVYIQAGAMQWFVGDVSAQTGIKSAGDFFSKLGRGVVTGESAIKPEYTGSGTLVLEPTYKHIILLEASQFIGGLVIEDGAFLAAESKLEQKISARKNLSSAVGGGEGLFNLCFVGQGIVALESYIPFEELILIDMQNDELKIDGSYAVCWSNSLDFTVERSSKTLIGSAASGEGLVNVYRGTGKVLMAPVG